MPRTAATTRPAYRRTNASHAPPSPRRSPSRLPSCANQEAPPPLGPAAWSGEPGKKVVPLVVDHDESREIHHLDAPDRLHSELGVFDDLDFANAIQGEASRRSTYRTEVKPAVLAAGRANLRAAVPFGESDEAPPGGHERIDVTVHAPGCRGSERPRCVPFWRLGRPRVIDRVVLDIVGQPLTAVEPLLQFGVGDVAGDDQRTAQAEARLDRVLREGMAHLCHRVGEIDRNDLAAERGGVDFGE